MKLQAPVKTLIATSLAHFVNDGSLYIFITLYDKILPSQGLLIGVLVALQNLFSVSVSPIIGRRVDASKNYGFYLFVDLVLIGIGVVGYSLSAILFSGFSRFLFLIPFAIIAGIGSSIYHPLGAAALHDVWRGKTLGRAMGINGAIGSSGRALYPLFVITLVVYLTLPSVATLAVVCFLSASIIFSILRGVQFAQGASKTEVSAKQEGKKDDRRVVPMSLILQRISGLTIIAFGRSVLSQGIVVFIPIYFTNELHVPFGLKLGAIFSLMLGMAVIGQPIFGSIADKLGRRTTIGISIIGSSGAILSFLFTNNLLLEIILLALFGFFVFTGFPIIMPLATSIVPEGAGAASGSIVWGVGTVGGGAVGPFLVGLLEQSSLLGSLHSSFFVVAGFSLATLAILPFVPKSREREQEVTSR